MRILDVQHRTSKYGFVKPVVEDVVNQ